MIRVEPAKYQRRYSKLINASIEDYNRDNKNMREEFATHGL